jgi:hypothetical protein
MGFVAFTLVVAQIVAATGYGLYFPWSIPALYSGIAGSDNTHLESVSYFILFFISVSGLIATFAWWRYADQT